MKADSRNRELIFGKFSQLEKLSPEASRRLARIDFTRACVLLHQLASVRPMLPKIT